MINLIERLDMPSLAFIRSQEFADLKIPTVVMHDNGFLPDNVDSPAKFYCGFTDEIKPLYFDRLPLPKYWRFKASSLQADVYDLDHKRATIFYDKTDNSRLVKEVQWLNKNGQLSWIDHYNKSGWKFAKTFFNNGRAVVRKLFDKNGKCVIEHNLIADDFYLDYQGTKKHFASLAEFTIHYLKDRGYSLDHIFYNTLNESMNVTLNLNEKGTDTMFWHEPVSGALPGNMEYLMNTKSRTKHIVFQRYDEWMKAQSMIPEDTGNVDFQYLGMVYPHSRSNQLRPNALIFTNSDQIEALDKIVTAMPNIRFNIAAVTEMSDKLMAFDQYDNVKLYPVVKKDKAAELLKECDLYFDINYNNEILSAVRSAFEQNMLIIGFRDTLHEPQFVADKYIFDASKIDKIKRLIDHVLESKINMKEALDYQRRMASDTTISEFKEKIEALENE